MKTYDEINGAIARLRHMAVCAKKCGELQLFRVFSRMALALEWTLAPEPMECAIDRFNSEVIATALNELN